MNYIKPVAKVLNVAIGEVFRLTEYPDDLQYRFTENGFEHRVKKDFSHFSDWEPSLYTVLGKIIAGETEIVKLEEGV